MGNKVIGKVGPKLGIYEESNDAQLSASLGQVREMEDGRKFRLCKAGEAIVATNVLQGPIESSDDENIVIAVSIAVGDKTVSITTARVYTANELKDGYFMIDDGDAGKLGHIRKIKSHPAAGSAETLVLTVYDAFTDTAVAGNETAGVYENPYSGVMIHNTATDGPLVGVAIIDITSAYYFWAQVEGPAAVVGGEASIVAGTSLTVDDTGATVTMADGASDQIVGRAMCASATIGDAFLAWLTLG